jgi:hypothetical protein
MTRSITDALLAPRPNETPESHQDRRDEVRRVCRAALADGAGHALINLLISAANPMRSRFPGAATAEEAAFLDGQADIVSFLILEGTDIGISVAQKTA